jgi:hypothetical protein
MDAPCNFELDNKATRYIVNLYVFRLRNRILNLLDLTRDWFSRVFQEEERSSICRDKRV